MKTGIFVMTKLPDQARSILEGLDVFEGEADDTTLAQCQVLMAWPSRVGKVLLLKMLSLRMIQALSAGVDGLDFTSLPPGIQVYSNAGAYTESVAEHAWGLLLGAAKGLHARKQGVVPRRLRSKTLLVVGCGAIGSEIARLGKSVGMKTVGVSRSFKIPDLFDEKHDTGDLRRIIGAADAVAIALPLTRRTAGLIDYSTLMLSNESVTMVNIGRAGTVSEEGLIRWLRERPESRYTTDVFWKKDGRETFDTEAWNFPNFSGTLHKSGAPLGDNLEHPMVEATKNVRRFLDTGSALSRIDLDEYLPSPRS
ncbi:MAG: NAD(P)-dependent oxidoreductase [Nitrososphaerales archaeon]